MMALRWRVRDIGEPERWNPHNLAAATGLAYSTVYNIWANKVRRADLDTMEKLATALRVDPGELIGPAESDEKE
jgi:DNA-binding Xre family transcriptional regulator